MEKILTIIWSLSFWGYIAVKVAGTSLVAWSWWWLLMPVMPILGLAVQRLGL